MPPCANLPHSERAPTLNTFCIPLPPVRAARPAHGGPPCREQERQETAKAKGKKPARQRGGRGRERKNRAGRRPEGTTGRERANPSRPLHPRGAGPAAGGGKPEPPTTTTSNRGGRGWRRIGPRAKKPPRGQRDARPQRGQGGPLAPPCGIFFAYLGGCGHPPPRIAARGPTRGADEGHTGTRPRGPAGPRQATPPLARRAIVGAWIIRRPRTGGV